MLPLHINTSPPPLSLYLGNHYSVLPLCCFAISKNVTQMESYKVKLLRVSFSTKIILLRPIHVVVYINSSFSSTTEYYSIAEVFQVVFNHLSAEGHLFHVLFYYAAPCFFFFLFFLFFFRAAPAAYGKSQARGQIRAAVGGLYHSHSNTGSKLHPQTMPYLEAMLDP